MGANSEYLIPFKGLENGVHYYRFQVSTDFFKNFESSRIQKGNYLVDLIFDKRDQMMIMDFSFQGNYHGACDRCLALIDIPHEGNDQIVVKLMSEATSNESGEIVILDDDTHEIDVSGYVNDLLHLFLPLVNERNCKEEDYIHCDHAVLDKIEGTQKTDKKEGGGNWDALKDLNLD